MVKRRPPVDALDKALRRRKQILALRAEQAREAQAAGNTTAASAASSSSSSHFSETPFGETGTPRRSSTRFAQQASLPTPSQRRHAGHQPTAFSSQSSSAVLPTSCSDALIEGNQALQRVLTQPPPLTAVQRQLRSVVKAAPSKQAAIDAFLVLARSANEPVPAQTFAALSRALVTRQAEQLLGPEAYSNALRQASDGDGEGSVEGRWQGLSAEEAAAFALYQCRRVERYTEKGTAFNTLLGMMVEGSDNAQVAQLEQQMRRHQHTTLPVSSDVLGDLMHLDVSWTTALHLYHYARELHGVQPPVELSDRLTGLMTGYRSNGLGSRPWQLALQLYEQVMQSGYDASLTTHTHALDALWRSADSAHKMHNTVSTLHQDWVWERVLRVRDAVAVDRGLRVSGEEGCAYMESLVKAATAAGRWEAAIGVLSDMDLTPSEASHRLLVPSAETFLFAIAACNAVGHASHAAALRALFDVHYTLHSVHSECLLVYLQSLRHVVHLSTDVGAQVERLTMDTVLLDRPCAMACLQLLTSASVRTDRAKCDLARRLFFVHYDSNPWQQQAQARKAELQTVFRCCYLVAAAEPQRELGEALLSSIRAYLVRVFGQHAAEVEWLADTEVYALQTVTSWTDAVAIFDRQVLKRPPEMVKFLPVPLRQAKRMFAEALLRFSRETSTEADGDFFLDDDTAEARRAHGAKVAQDALSTVEDLTRDAESEIAPHELLAELLLRRAEGCSGVQEKRAYGVRAMRELALGAVSAISPPLQRLVGDVLGLTEPHVVSVLVEGHAQLRGTVLDDAAGKKLKAASAVEAFYW